MVFHWMFTRRKFLCLSVFLSILAQVSRICFAHLAEQLVQYPTASPAYLNIIADAAGVRGSGALRLDNDGGGFPSFPNFLSDRARRVEGELLPQQRGIPAAVTVAAQDRLALVAGDPTASVSRRLQQVPARHAPISLAAPAGVAAPAFFPPAGHVEYGGQEPVAAAAGAAGAGAAGGGAGYSSSASSFTGSFAKQFFGAAAAPRAPALSAASAQPSAAASEAVNFAEDGGGDENDSTASDSEQDLASAEEEEEAILAWISFFLFSLLAAAVLQWLVSCISAYSIPASIVWFIFGMLIDLSVARASETSGNAIVQGIRRVAKMNAEVVYLILLPILLYEASLNVDWHKFKRFAISGITLAVLGVAYQVAVVGLLIQITFPSQTFISSDASWWNSFLIASSMASTDPVAVISVLTSLQAPPKLGTMFDGEALINDGSSMLLFQFFKSLAHGEVETLGDVVGRFLSLLVFAPLWGVAVSYLAYVWMRRFNVKTQIASVALLTTAYVVYVAGEKVLHTSGPISVVCFGLFYNGFGHISLENEAQVHLHHSVQALGSLANSSVFVIAGVVAMRMMYEAVTATDGLSTAQVWNVPVLYLYLLLARASMVLVFLPVLRRTGYGVNWREMVLLVWGGIRGAIVLAMGLMIEQDHQILSLMRYEAVLYIAGCTFAILLINGGTFELLYRLLNPYPPKPFRRVYMEKVMKLIDYQYMEERRVLQNHWLFRGTNILAYSEKVAPVLGWRRMNERGKIDLRLPSIAAALQNLPTCETWIPPPAEPGLEGPEAAAEPAAPRGETAKPPTPAAGLAPPKAPGATPAAGGDGGAAAGDDGAAGAAGLQAAAGVGPGVASGAAAGAGAGAAAAASGSAPPSAKPPRPPAFRGSKSHKPSPTGSGRGRSDDGPAERAQKTTAALLGLRSDDARDVFDAKVYLRLIEHVTEAEGAEESGEVEFSELQNDGPSPARNAAGGVAGGVAGGGKAAGGGGKAAGGGVAFAGAPGSAAGSAAGGSAGGSAGGGFAGRPCSSRKTAPAPSPSPDYDPLRYDTDRTIVFPLGRDGESASSSEEESVPRDAGGAPAPAPEPWRPVSASRRRPHAQREPFRFNSEARHGSAPPAAAGALSDSSSPFYGSDDEGGGRRHHFLPYRSPAPGGRVEAGRARPAAGGRAGGGGGAVGGGGGVGGGRGGSRGAAASTTASAAAPGASAYGGGAGGAGGFGFGAAASAEDLRGLIYNKTFSHSAFAIPSVFSEPLDSARLDSAALIDFGRMTRLRRPEWDQRSLLTTSVMDAAGGAGAAAAGAGATCGGAAGGGAAFAFGPRGRMTSVAEEGAAARHSDGASAAAPPGGGMPLMTLAHQHAIDAAAATRAAAAPWEDAYFFSRVTEASGAASGSFNGGVTTTTATASGPLVPAVAASGDAASGAAASGAAAAAGSIAGRGAGSSRMRGSHRRVPSLKRRSSPLADLAPPGPPAPGAALRKQVVSRFRRMRASTDKFPLRVVSAPTGKIDLLAGVSSGGAGVQRRRRQRLRRLAESAELSGSGGGSTSPESSIRSSEEYLEMPETPRTPSYASPSGRGRMARLLRQPAVAPPPPAPVRVKVLRKEREGELFIMVFNAVRQMYAKLYAQKFIGGAAMLALSSCLDHSIDFALGKLRKNPINAWKEVLESLPKNATSDGADGEIDPALAAAAEQMTGFEYEWRSLVARLRCVSRRGRVARLMQTRVKQHWMRAALTYAAAMSDLEVIVAYVDVHEELLFKGGPSLILLLGPKLVASYKLQLLAAKRFVSVLRSAYPEAYPYTLAVHGATLLINLKAQLVGEQYEKGLIQDEDFKALAHLFEEQLRHLGGFSPGDFAMFFAWLRDRCKCRRRRGGQAAAAPAAAPGASSAAATVLRPPAVPVHSCEVELTTPQATAQQERASQLL